MLEKGILGGKNGAERTALVGAILPECLPFTKVERHAALGVDYHRE